MERRRRFGKRKRIWQDQNMDVRTGSKSLKQRSQRRILSLAFSPDSTSTGKRQRRQDDQSLATFAQRDWTDHIETGLVTAMPSNNLHDKSIGHSDSVSSVDYSRDGARLLSGGWDGHVMEWDLATGQRLRDIDTGSPARNGPLRK